MSKYGLTVGTPEIESVGSIAFGPEGILFIADNRSASIFAVDVGDERFSVETTPIDVDNVDARLAAFLGSAREDVVVRDMAVHPSSQSVYLSVMRGRGSDAVPLLVRVERDGTLEAVSLAEVPFSQISLDDAPGPEDERVVTYLDGLSPGSEEIEIHGVRLNIFRDRLRTSTVTDLAWIDGTLLVAGASNEEFSSALRRIPFPFTGEALTNALEIYHVSHGKYETASPIRTFVPFDGNSSVLASYTCTPVVHFAITDLESGALAKGRTIAELGAMNQPLDMVSYTRDGEEYLLVSNTRHPLLKIPCSTIGGQVGLTDPTEPVGVPREELPQEGVTYMANLNGSYVVMMQHDGAGSVHLRSYRTASL